MWPFSRKTRRTISPVARRVVIIGNGITGVTCALRLRRKKPDWRITLISGESAFHYSRPALMYIYLGHLRFEDTKPYEDSHWDRYDIERVVAWVKRIDTNGKKLELDRGEAVPYDDLVIATGSKPNKFGWPGQDLDRVQGMCDLQDLEALKKNTPDLKHAVIVGGGLIGIEMAEMIHSRGIPVTMLARETNYWNNVLPDHEAKMINRAAWQHGIDLRLSTELAEIVDDGRGRAAAAGDPRCGGGRRREPAQDRRRPHRHQHRRAHPPGQSGGGLAGLRRRFRSR